MNTNKFTRSPACANCGKYEEAHFDGGYCERQKPEVTSPLSDDEIDAIWWSIKPVGNEMPSHHDIGRAIANAAHARCLQDEAKVREELIARYDSLQSQYAELSVASILGAAAQAQDALTRKAVIREIAAMPSETNLDCSGGGYSAAMMQEFGNACIAKFQRKLLAGIGE